VEVSGLSLPLVFLAGVVSFISPCVLPLVPGYLATVSGVSFERISARSPGVTRRVAAASALFFAGFLVVFIALGASASLIGAMLDDNRSLLNRVAGALIVVFGLAMLGVGWSGMLNARITRFVHDTARRRGGPVALGVAFAFCWTPCVGPILASILVVAGASASLPSGVVLLAVYGFGLAAPFLLVGLGFTRALSSFRRIQTHYRALQASAGLLLIAMGTLLLSGYLYLVNVYAQRLLQALGLDWWTSL
jgi:cytochrome c-type biogenesis protein